MLNWKNNIIYYFGKLTVSKYLSYRWAVYKNWQQKKVRLIGVKKDFVNWYNNSLVKALLISLR